MPSINEGRFCRRRVGQRVRVEQRVEPQLVVQVVRLEKELKLAFLGSAPTRLTELARRRERISELRPLHRLSIRPVVERQMSGGNYVDIEDKVRLT